MATYDADGACIDCRPSPHGGVIPCDEHANDFFSKLFRCLT